MRLLALIVATAVRITVRVIPTADDQNLVHQKQLSHLLKPVFTGSFHGFLLAMPSSLSP